MEELDRSLRTLAGRKDAWARLPVGTKIRYLEAVRENTHALAPQWVRAALAAKQIALNSPLAGEEWLSGPYAVLYALNRYIRTLREILAHGLPQLPHGAVRTDEDGRVVVRVFPATLYDRLLYAGISADVYMLRDVTKDRLADSMAAFYKQSEPRGHVALVLGAGNIAAIAPLDALYKFIAEGAVCIVKLNPVNDYLGPILERAFEPFVTSGYLRFAYGSAGVGDYLCRHDLVQSIHLTGSQRTHEAVRAAVAHLNKRFTSELGNVSPTIVLPGNWSARDFRFQAENIVTQKMHNAGFNCIASQVLVLPREWSGTPKLLEAISRLLRELAPRYPYYPGARARIEATIDGRDNTAGFFRADADNPDDPAFTDETFGAALAHIELPGDPQTYLRAAVLFANTRLRGNLGANLIVDPVTKRRLRSEIAAATRDLDYGCIGVNAWTGVGFFLAETPWGALAGQASDDVRSGLGTVHNRYLFERSQKSVIHAPFRPFPKPPWFVTNRAAARVGELLCEFEAHPSPLGAAKVAAAALGG